MNQNQPSYHLLNFTTSGDEDAVAKRYHQKPFKLTELPVVFQFDKVILKTDGKSFGVTVGTIGRPSFMGIYQLACALGGDPCSEHREALMDCAKSGKGVALKMDSGGRVLEVVKLSTTESKL